MHSKPICKTFFLFTEILLVQLLLIGTVQAIPSFARQTGMKCNECHTVFPELTPFGRLFKLGGYVMSKSGKSYEFPPPLAGMVQASFSDSKGLTSGVAPFDKTNRATDRINLPQEHFAAYTCIGSCPDVSKYSDCSHQRKNVETVSKNQINCDTSLQGRTIVSLHLSRRETGEQV